MLGVASDAKGKIWEINVTIKLLMAMLEAPGQHECLGKRGHCVLFIFAQTTAVI